MEASMNYNGDIYEVKATTEHGIEMFEDYFEDLLSLEDLMFSDEAQGNIEIKLLAKGC